MILEREQIQRYMRHIIMPEIGGPGQKKLLDSSVIVCCDAVSNASVLLYYLAAMGIGNIRCHAKVIDGLETISQNARGLNPDLDFQTVDMSGDNEFILASGFNAIIMLCEEPIANLKIDAQEVPIIFSAAAGSCGYLRTARTKNAVNQAVDELKGFFNDKNGFEYLPIFRKAYLGLICTVTAVEAVKALLDIGDCNEHALQFNLDTYDFKYGQITDKKPEYTVAIKSAVEKLAKAKVLIVGCGGLGSPAAYMLAMAGIGKLGLIDYDSVEISNLNRQILHSTDTVGMAKVRSAERFLSKINPGMVICTYEHKFSLENAEKIVAEYDLVIDGLDNLPNRYLLNDICYFLKKPWLEAGVLRFNGLATTIIPDVSPCYRCIFPEVIDKSPMPSCSESGVLGAVPGVMGMIQAIEAIKYLTGVGVPLVGKMLSYDALYNEFTLFDVDRSPDCELCGINPAGMTSREYDYICRNKQSS